MQPNPPNKPVMDVTPANGQGAPAQPEREPAPQIHNSPDQSGQIQAADHQSEAPAQEQPNDQQEPAQEDKDAPKQELQKSKSTVPAGVITVAVFIMLVLVGLAVAAYLNSR